MNCKSQTPIPNVYLSTMLALPPTIEEKTNAALQGDVSAFGSIFQWYNPRLYAHALRICGNTPLAQDAVQETFISAFIHRNSLRNPALFYPWLKRILTNHCYRLLSKEKVGGATDECIEKKDIIIQRSIEENFEKTANQQWVYAALNQLSEELRACVMLRHFTNFKSYVDIATILGIPIGTVRSRLSAAREKLLSAYKKIDDAADNALNDSKKWSNYYVYIWNNLYYNTQVRNEFLQHMHPLMNIRFTSGKPARGRTIIADMFNEDITYGSELIVNQVASSGEISVIEGANLNSTQFPDHCPPSSIMVLFRKREQVQSCHIFDSPRNI